MRLPETSKDIVTKNNKIVTSYELPEPATGNRQQVTDIQMEAVAKLMNYPTSPRKMRLLADLIRGMAVENAIATLEHHPKHPATPLGKLLKSAINNWEQKNEGTSAADATLVVKTIMVDGARTLRRMRPAPQGRGYRIRKRSNHVTIIVDTKTTEVSKNVYGSNDRASKNNHS
ncbi:MAG: ribosomal protein [Segetibacter sp.]|nr:ribosomal protein [Segetibacter sp.]